MLVLINKLHSILIDPTKIMQTIKYTYFYLNKPNEVLFRYNINIICVKYTVKKALVEIWIIFLYKEGHPTVRNKADLDSNLLCVKNIWNLKKI